MYIKLATGVGAGIIADGRVLRGSTGTAGEIGHLTVDDRGPVCRCGNRGCLEMLVGADHLVRLLGPSHGNDLTIERLSTLATAGDRGCRRVIADAGRILGVTVANLVNVVNPQRIVVGGELGTIGDLLLDPIRQAIARCAVHEAAQHVQVISGQLGARAEALGGVALALHETGSYVAVPSPHPINDQ
ncbi:ROK family protein [Streptomyces sp. ISL-98]|nr:ROK family protein [Streptomyces sp. ISL-98]